MYKMIGMLQLARLQQNCYKFNALVVLLTLILCDRFSIDFAITVNPIETIKPSSIEYINYDTDEVHTGSKTIEITTSTSSDFKISVPDEFSGLPEVENVDSVDFLTKASIDPALVDEKASEDKSDTFEDILNMYAIQNSLLDLPNFYNSRITIVPKVSQKSRLLRPLTSLADGLKDRLKAIYPGTLWCGDGNQAKNDHEIGLFRNTDICCKQHDQCPAFIRAGKEFKGLRNTGHFTRSHCDCDLKFYNCLKRTGSIVSNKIGYTYFNILRPPCFSKQYPIVGCKKRVNNKCYVYMIDDEKPPVWQWFQNRMY